MWATRADNRYTVNGRMAPQADTPDAHQFKIEVTCASVETAYVTIHPPAG
jgi:hypothetical protein